VKSSVCVTAAEGETIWRPSPRRAPPRKRKNARGERRRRQGCQREDRRKWRTKKAKCGYVKKSRRRRRPKRSGRRLPTDSGDPPKRTERRETLGASVSMGATHRVHAPRVTADDDEPGAGEYGYSDVECWEADIGRTHLDRGARGVARRTTSSRPSSKHIFGRHGGIARQLLTRPRVSSESETRRANGCASRGAETSQMRRNGKDARGETREDVTIRYQASWVVGRLPFTGQARDHPDRAGESKARVTPAVRQDARVAAATNRRGAGGSCL